MKRVLSLFNGMGCGQIVLTNMKIEHEYYYSEIDKHANYVQNLNFPNSIPLGDITKWKEWDIDLNFDLILAGSPCHGFSFAGKQLNFEDERSKLFFVFVEILEHVKKINPNVMFLLENVNMKKEFIRIISEHVGLFPSNLNSNLVSAQNRDRLYWTNIRTKKVGLFCEVWSDIPEPKDRGIFLKDILQPESEVDKKYYLSSKAVKGILKHLNEQKSKGNGFGAKLHIGNDKFNALKVGGTGIDDIYCVSMVGAVKFGRTEEAKELRRKKLKKGRDYTPFSKKEIVDIDFDKMGALMTSLNKDNLIFTQNYIQTNNNGHKSQKERYYFEGKKAPTLGIGNSMKSPNIITTHSLQKRNGKGNGGKDHLSKDDGKSYCIDTKNGQAIEYDYKLRRLTPLECCRLQTVPECLIGEKHQILRFIKCAETDGHVI